MNPRVPLRGVVLGAGYFSRFQYEAWARIPEVEIVAVVNRDVAKAREAAARASLEHDEAVKAQRAAQGTTPPTPPGES